MPHLLGAALASLVLAGCTVTGPTRSAPMRAARVSPAATVSPASAMRPAPSRAPAAAPAPATAPGETAWRASESAHREYLQCLDDYVARYAHLATNPNDIAAGAMAQCDWLAVAFEQADHTYQRITSSQRVADEVSAGNLRALRRDARARVTERIFRERASQASLLLR